jgi:hypothetical protein
MPQLATWYAKNATTCDLETSGRWPVGASPSKKKFLQFFFWFFFVSNFAECRTLSKARQKSLGKDGFADTFFYRMEFAECLPSITVALSV